MTAQQASQRWQSRQAATLAATYRQGWQAGIRNYQSQNPPAQGSKPPPSKPPTVVQARALTPALSSLARMGAQIALLVPSAAQIAAAGTIAAALVLALKEYLQANAWLLAAGAAVAWSGEQAGYAHAAHADGLLLHWQLDKRARHCEDCPALAALPPLPLELWPTLPGEGQTECSVGCRCSMGAVEAAVPVLDTEQEQLLAQMATHEHVLVAA